jgi:hypothetical protein
VENLNRWLMITIAVIAAHAAHLSTLGNENIILGCLGQAGGYPPKWVYLWYAKRISKFIEQEGLEKPFHFAFKQCVQYNPLSKDCIELFEIMRSRNKAPIDYEAPSNSEYRFRPIHIAIMNCNVDAIHYLRGRGVDVDKKPGPGPYERVGTLQFLFSTECTDKRGLKQALYDKASPKYAGDFLKGPDWNDSEIFK